MLPVETRKEVEDPSTRKDAYLVMVAKAISAYWHSSERACADNLERTLKQRGIGDTASIYELTTEMHNNWKPPSRDMTKEDFADMNKRISGSLKKGTMTRGEAYELAVRQGQRAFSSWNLIESFSC